jgi:hypothetical protein
MAPGNRISPGESVAATVRKGEKEFCSGSVPIIRLRARALRSAKTQAKIYVMPMGEFVSNSGETLYKGPDSSVQALAEQRSASALWAPKQYNYLRTSSVTVVVCVTPPPLAVMVMVWFPSEALLPTLTVIVEVPAPGAAMLLGLKVTV